MAQLSALATGSGTAASGAADTLDALSRSLRAATDPSKAPSAAPASRAAAKPSTPAATGPSASLKTVVDAYREQSVAKAA